MITLSVKIVARVGCRKMYSFTYLFDLEPAIVRDWPYGQSIWDIITLRDRLSVVCILLEAMVVCTCSNSSVNAIAAASVP